MAYEIQAWLGDDGAPRLRLIDSQSGRIRLSWVAHGTREPDLKALFHELMLLSAGDRLADIGTLAYTSRTAGPG